MAIPKSKQDYLNSLAGTTGKTRQEAANILAGTTGKTLQEAINIWAGTSGKSIADALNFKAGTTGLTPQEALQSLVDARVPHWTDGVALGNFDNSANWQEISGITYPTLPANANFLWVESDSPANMIAAVSATDASNKGVLTLTGQTAMSDLEDIESARIGGISYLYAMDFGNNGNALDSRGAGIDLRIFRIVEPTITGSNISTTNFIEITCVFPAGNVPSSRDCEGCIVDPDTGDIYIITKREAVPSVYKLAHALTYTGIQTLTYMGQMFDIPDVTTSALGGTAVNVTDAAISPDGTEILVKNYNDIYYFPRNKATQTIYQALQQTGTIVPAYVGGGSVSPAKSHPNAEPQGEGITYSPDGLHLYSASEYLDTAGSSASSYPLFKYTRSRAVPTTVSFQDGVSPTAGYTGTTTTYIWGTNPTTDRSAEVTYVVDFTSGNPTDDRRGLLKFDLSSIPTTATILGARLDQWLAAEGQGWKVYKMLVTWNGASTHTLLGGVDNDGVKAAVAQSWRNGINLDTITGISVRDNVLVADVQGMVSNPATNFGWLLKGLDESAGGDGIQFESKAAVTASHRPKLTIRYI